jgi:site-specific recombinase XerD
MVERNFTVMKDLQGYFKEGERKAMYNAADSPRDKLLIRLLWISGRRITEVLQIKVHEIDFQLNKIAFHIEKKTEKVNGIKQKKDLVKLKPIDDFTAKLLKWYINETGLKPDNYLFESEFKTGSPISRQRAFQVIRFIAEKAGVEKVGGKLPHAHHFRHSFAIDMARKMETPADLRKLQMMLEHANLGVTEQYLQFSDEELRDMSSKVGD